MKNVVAVVKRDGEYYGGIWGSWEDFHSDTFSPDWETIFCYDFTTKGKTYTDRKEFVRDHAIDWQHACSLSADWSYGEFAIIEGEFERLGKQYGLMREFHENAIC